MKGQITNHKSQTTNHKSQIRLPACLRRLTDSAGGPDGQVNSKFEKTIFKRSITMNNKTYLITSGVLFGLITIGQLIRLIFQVPVQLGSLHLPMWASVLAIIVALSLCIWAFRLAGKQ
jgi:hypothetical protein